MKHKMIEKLHSKIKRASTIFVMGHRELDLDALASCVAICDIAKNKKKFIIIDDEKCENGVGNALELIDKKIIIKSNEIKKHQDPNGMLVIVDTNKKELLQNSEVVTLFKNIVVIDHHDVTENKIDNSLQYIDTTSSSASELIVEYIHYYDLKISKLTATLLLAGISLDTNNFYIKTTGKTHYGAYYLIELGADIEKSNSFFKEDIDKYLLRQKVIDDVEIINKHIAFAKASNRIIYKKEELAKTADTLVEFINIDIGFVIARLEDNSIGLSVRNTSDYDIGNIISKIGGGGDKYNAAARFENKTINEVEEIVKNLIMEDFE